MLLLSRISVILAASAVLVACASGPNEQSPTEDFTDDPRLGESIDKICFGRSINGFGKTTDRTIIVRANVGEHYLLETFGYCRDLAWAQTIALDQYSSCLTTADSLIPYGSLFGPSAIEPQTCRIKTIYKWNPEAGQETSED